MSYLLDTDVVRELARARASANVVAWLRSVPEEGLFLSVLSLGELRQGVEKLGPGRRRERMRVWLESELPAWFGDRLLPVSREVADRSGRLLAGAGRTVSAIDALVAATALVHGLRLVSRKPRDFRFPGLDVVNPWGRG